MGVYALLFAMEPYASPRLFDTMIDVQNFLRAFTWDNVVLEQDSEDEWLVLTVARRARWGSVKYVD